MLQSITVFSNYYLVSYKPVTNQLIIITGHIQAPDSIILGLVWMFQWVQWLAPGWLDCPCWPMCQHICRKTSVRSTATAWKRASRVWGATKVELLGGRYWGEMGCRVVSSRWAKEKWQPSSPSGCFGLLRTGRSFCQESYRYATFIHDWCLKILEMAWTRRNQQDLIRISSGHQQDLSRTWG